MHTPSLGAWGTVKMTTAMVDWLVAVGVGCGGTRGIGREGRRLGDKAAHAMK
jgi:hypothetical protein